MGVRYIFGQDGAFRTEPVIVAKNITENGTYDPATEGADGYAPVVVNVEGGGGSTWQTVFEGNVTAVEDGDWCGVWLENLSLTQETLKVTFNGTEYECEKNADGSYGAPLNESTDKHEWDIFPFNLLTEEGDTVLSTQTAGTYTLKIEEPQSGGSSDFSTAEVTFICDGSEGAYYSVGNIAYIDDGILRASGYRTFPQPSADLRVDKGTNVTLDMILYKNILPYDVFAHYDDSVMPIITGNAEMTEQGLQITGSCSIQLTGYSAS